LLELGERTIEDFGNRLRRARLELFKN